MTTLVAVAIVWRYLYHPHYGLLNYMLGWSGSGPIDWLGDPHWAMPAIILLSVWKNFGYNMLIFVAGLQSIPKELYEAAAIDGAGAWRRFRHVTLPGLAPTFLFVGVTTMIGYFQLFAEPYVMTQGGPAAEHDQHRPLDVRGGIPMVADGDRLGDRLHPARRSRSWGR